MRSEGRERCTGRFGTVASRVEQPLGAVPAITSAKQARESVDSEMLKTNQGQPVTRPAHVSNMHQLVPRIAPAVQLDLSQPSSSAPPAFPGLVSSLRPIRRIAPQVADEAALLRRFTYKHKNQHKGQRWWKRIVEVDRAASRAVDELQAWLGVFSLRCVDRLSCSRAEY